MRLNPRTTLAIAINHNRIGCVYFIDKQPMLWELSYLASRSVDQARSKIDEWLEIYDVDCVVTEVQNGVSRKGKRTQILIDKINHQLANRDDVDHFTIRRQQPFPSKYEQIDDLCCRYPQMRVIAPKKRRYWENEPAVVTLFDALAMGEQVLKLEPPRNLPT